MNIIGTFGFLALSLPLLIWSCGLKPSHRLEERAENSQPSAPLDLQSVKELQPIPPGSNIGKRELLVEMQISPLEQTQHPEAKKIDYYDLKPLFSGKCGSCHEDIDAMFKTSDLGFLQQVLDRVSQPADAPGAMPPAGTADELRFTGEDLELLSQWLQQGAPFIKDPSSIPIDPLASSLPVLLFGYELKTTKQVHKIEPHPLRQGAYQHLMALEAEEVPILLSYQLLTDKREQVYAAAMPLAGDAVKIEWKIPASVLSETLGNNAITLTLPPAGNGQLIAQWAVKLSDPISGDEVATRIVDLADTRIQFKTLRYGNLRLRVEGLEQDGNVVALHEQDYFVLMGENTLEISEMKPIQIEQVLAYKIKSFSEEQFGTKPQAIIVLGDRQASMEMVSPGWFKAVVKVPAATPMVVAIEVRKDDEVIMSSAHEVVSRASAPILMTSTAPPTALWLDRVIRALRNQASISRLRPAYKQLAQLPTREAVVDRLMQDELFVDTMLMFNLGYLGRAPNELVELSPVNGTLGYRPEIFAYPQALASAAAAIAGGDYFDLFSPQPRIYAPITNLATPEVMETMANQLDSDLDLHFATYIESDAALDKVTDFCLIYARDFKPKAQVAMVAMGLEESFVERLLKTIAQEMFRLPKLDNEFSCYLPGSDTFNGYAAREQIREALRDIKEIMGGLVVQDQKAPVASSTSHKLATYHPFGRKETHQDLYEFLPALTVQGFWQHLTGSSTNHNRKRAAYMLRTYFCDDLTPLEVVTASPKDEEELENQHGSNPACMSCHYKLDPIGGLFRNKGRLGADFTGKGSIQFDDQAKFSEDKLSNYLSTWEKPDGEAWVGFYISPSQKHEAWQGQELDDFWAFLRNSGEAKECLVRRLAEFYLGADRPFDGKWLEEISADLVPGEKSGIAMKNLVKELALSNSFASADVSKDLCLDVGADLALSDGSSQVPCAISYTLKKHCASCHTGSSSIQRLDLTKMIATKEGPLNFVHISADGSQVNKLKTYQAILERLNTGDKERVMPPSSPMPDADKQAMFQWLKREIDSLGEE